MSANTIITSIVTGGTDTHTTTAEEANAVRTDFGTAGVIGAITLNTGSGGTGAYCVNQNTGSNLAINILAGTAQYALTPSGQGSQMVRATAAADYTAYTINSNSTGSTKYDWIYLKGDATKGNNPAPAADDVTAIYTSRSSSNTTDNGTPPTYGLLLAVVTVANGATAITNSNISDKRYNASLGAQNGSLIVNQNGTGTDAIIQAAGIDGAVTIDVTAKGSTGNVNLKPGASGTVQINGTQIGAGAFKNPYKFSITTPYGTPASSVSIIKFTSSLFDTGSNYSASTGLFTAPVAGFYFFSTSVEVNTSNGGNNLGQIILYKNGSNFMMLDKWEVSAISGSVDGSGSMLLQLAANDTVAIWASNSISTSYGVGHFGGFLVSAT